LNHEIKSLARTGIDARHQILRGIGELHRAKPCDEYLRLGQHFLLQHFPLSYEVLQPPTLFDLNGSGCSIHKLTTYTS
jgi:hypothetical protein